MPLPGAYQITSNLTEWSDKDKEAYWKLQDDKKEREEVRRKRQPICDGLGLKDNDGW